MNVRAIGLYRNLQDIENTVLTTKNGTAVRVKDVGVVEMGPRIRLGHMARATHRPDGAIVDEPDVIQGSVLMLKGAEEAAHAGRHSRESEGAQRSHPARRREAHSHAGPHRSAPFHPAYRGAQPGAKG